MSCDKRSTSLCYFDVFLCVSPQSSLLSLPNERPELKRFLLFKMAPALSFNSDGLTFIVILLSIFCQFSFSSFYNKLSSLTSVFDGATLTITPSLRSYCHYIICILIFYDSFTARFVSSNIFLFCFSSSSSSRSTSSTCSFT